MNASTYNSVLDMPIEKQKVRAQRAGQTLEQWQADTKSRLSRMSNAAIASVNEARKRNLSLAAIERFQKKMDSAIQ